MSREQPRDDDGNFEEKVSDQDILVAFDTPEEPVLTATELAEQFPVSAEAIRQRLERLREEGKVGKKKTGARSVAWWAEVAPQLDPEVAAEVDDRRENDEFVPLTRD